MDAQTRVTWRPCWITVLVLLGSLSVLQAAEVTDSPFYLPYDELLEFLVDDPSPVAVVQEIGMSDDGRPLRAVKISDNPGVDEDEATLLFIGVIHGREPLGVRVVLQLIEDLTEGYASDPQVQDWVNAYEIWVVPVMNPYGYDNVKRKNNPSTVDPNTSGVDLNRNFDFRWDQCVDCSDPESGVFSGPFAASEPEVQALADLVRQQKPVFGIIFHSGSGGPDGHFLLAWDPPAIEPVDSDRLFEEGDVVANAIFTSRSAGPLCDSPEPIPGACMIPGLFEGAAIGQDFNYYYAAAGMFHYLIETNGDLDGSDPGGDSDDDSELWIDDFFYEDTPALDPDEQEHFDHATEFVVNYLDGIKGLLDHFLCDTVDGYSFTGPGITGQTFDHDGTPVAAQVKLLASGDDDHDDDLDDDGDVDEDDRDVDGDGDPDLDFRVSDAEHGRYLRLLIQGTYTLEFSRVDLPTVTRDVNVAGGCLLELDVYLQSPPVADAGPDQEVECSSFDGADVVLDGSGSTDPDSSPGTNDDIVLFEWFEDFGLPGQTLLGTGEILPATFSLGSHNVTLRVTDLRDETDTDSLVVDVLDTTPPTLDVEISPELLWPPNHGMRDVVASVTLVDECDPTPVVVLTSVYSSEPDDAPGGGDGKTVNDVQDAELETPDFLFMLRAERAGSGPGRTYEATYTATDASDNPASASAIVSVPHDQGG